MVSKIRSLQLYGYYDHREPAQVTNHNNKPHQHQQTNLKASSDTNNNSNQK